MTKEEKQMNDLQEEAVMINQAVKAEMGEMHMQIIALKAKCQRLEVENERLKAEKEGKKSKE